MTSGIPTVVAPKLSKLIPLLASDKDGEVVATVRAIGRALKQAGADFHDLAAAVTVPAAVPLRPRHRHTRTDADIAAIREALSSDRISAWEESFLISIAGFLRAGHALSAKQKAVLDRIMLKTGVTP